MKSAVFIPFAVVMAVSFCSCRVQPGDGPEASAPAEGEGTVRAGGGSSAGPAGVNIYLLADRTIDLEAAQVRPLGKLVLQKEPWIASENIARYDSSSHYLYLKNAVSVPGRMRSLRGVPFVVTADGQRCYVGGLWWAAWSSIPRQSTTLIDIDLGFAPLDIFFMELESVQTGTRREVADLPHDPRIVQALTRQGQYHAGLSLSLDGVEIQPREGGATIRYTYTLQNNDTDDLYVLDPERMRPGLFHYFCRPMLYPRAGGRAIDVARSLMPERVTAAEIWDPRWFSCIKSGASMTRTVVAEDYPKVPPGEYECSLSLYLPREKATRGRITRPDGRVWLGGIWATLPVAVGQDGQDL